MRTDSRRASTPRPGSIERQLEALLRDLHAPLRTRTLLGKREPVLFVQMAGRIETGKGPEMAARPAIRAAERQRRRDQGMAGPLPAQQFTGQERDALERQDYFGARYYRPRHGRFSQVDPVYAGLFDPQQWNRYAYARNNPLSYVDPDGRNPTSCFDFAGAVRCVGEGTTVTAPLPRPITPTSPAQPPDPTAAAAEALAAMNNSCLGDGNSRACGSQGRERKGRVEAERAGWLAELFDEHVADLDAMPPGDATVIELGLVVVEKNVEIIATGLLVPPVAKALDGIGGDLIRFGTTRVSNQLISGSGVPGLTTSTWAIKGGGPRMPYHFHIHDWNWYKPWEWFRRTDIVPLKWRY